MPKPKFKLVTLIALALLTGCTYSYRYVFWNNSDIGDYRKFPARNVENAPPVFHFKDAADSGAFKQALPKAEFQRNGKTVVMDWEKFLESTGTTAFIVIKDDAILYEGYFNGYRRDSINVSFSVAKSYTSALVGIAIDEGLISSVHDPVTKYLPELKKNGFEKITIRNLLMMNAGVKWSDMPFPWSDDPKHYYHSDLRKLLLNLDKFESKPGEYFHYDSYYPLLMAMVLDRVTGMSVSKWTEEKLWKPLGMEFPASWSLDSEIDGIEKTGSSINARPIDYAKFGRLFLNKGNWNGKQIISESWVAESTSRDRSVEHKDYYKKQKLFSTKPYLYYKYFWWGITNTDTEYDYTGIGHLGQFIYVSPAANVVIMRNGKELGGVDFWPDIFRDIAKKL